MDLYTVAGIACIVAAALLLAGVIVVFRSPGRREPGQAMPLTTMLTLGVLGPLLFLAGVVLLAVGND